MALSIDVVSQRRLPPPCRYVYVIGPETGLQKIGIATDPRARLAALQTASPFKLMIHVSVPVPFESAHDVEKRAHQHLRLYRAAGEWFDTTPPEAAAAVKAAALMHAAMGDEAAVLPFFAFTQRGGASPTSRLLSPPSTGLRTGLGRLWNVARKTLVAG